MSQENQKIWYLFDGGVVSGPFDKDDLRRLADARTNPSSMIWQRGHTEWQTFRTWVDVNFGWGDTWYIANNGVNSGPFPMNQIARSLRMRELPMNIQLWTVGLKKWVRPYDVNNLIKAVGLPVRRHLRAPFVGDVKVQGFFVGSKVSAVSLSVGGIAVTNMKKIGTNARVGLKVNSDLLDGPFEAKARVVYQKGSTAGLEFTSLSPEALEIVNEYCRQFAVREIA
jgi:hypothetical protein